MRTSSCWTRVDILATTWPTCENKVATISARISAVHVLRRVTGGGGLETPKEGTTGGKIKCIMYSISTSRRPQTVALKPSQVERGKGDDRVVVLCAY